MSISHRAHGAVLEENLIRLDQVIYIPGSWAYLTRELMELIEDGEEDDLLIEAGFPDIGLAFLRSGETDASDFAEFEIVENRITGFFVKGSTPSPSESTRLVDGRAVHATYTWGITTWKWVYAETLDHAIQLLIDWKDELLQAAHDKRTNKEGQPS